MYLCFRAGWPWQSTFDMQAHKHRMDRRKLDVLLHKTRSDVERMSVAEIQSLIHELQVRQCELEVQNEQLRSAELEVEEARDRYLELYDFAPVGYLTLDRSGTVIEANLTIAALLGIERGSLLGAPLARLIACDFQDAWYLYLRRFSSGVMKEKCELQLVKTDGATVFVQVDGLSNRREQEGNDQIRICVTDLARRKELEGDLRELNAALERRVAERTVQLAERNEALRKDIIERRAAEERLRESERRFHAIFDQRYQLAGLLTTEGILIAANARSLSLIDLPEAQVIGRPFWETPWWTHSAELQQRLRAGIEEAGKGNLVHFEATHPGSDGTLAHVDFTIRPITDDAGNVVLLVPESHDISEQKALLEKLRRDEAWLRSLIETTQDAVVSIDRTGGIVLFNPAAERIFGYDKTEVQGLKVNMLMAEPYASRHDSFIARYEETGEAHAIGQIRIVAGRRKNDEIFPIELSVTEITVDENIHYAAFIRDISEKARIQTQLVEKGRLAAVGATAAAVAHEISNPLNSLSMTIQLIERRLASLDDALGGDVGAKFKAVKGEVQRLAGLLSDFTSLARKQEYSFERRCLATLCGSVLEMEEPLFTNQGICVERALPSDLVQPLIEQSAFTQVLINLFKNAREAMPQGGTLSVRAWNEGQEIVLEIGDTGTGVPDDIDIFEPFVSTKTGGTGLGMMITRKIIADHRGTITYSSQPDVGTVFRVTLPVGQPN